MGDSLSYLLILLHSLLMHMLSSSYQKLRVCLKSRGKNAFPSFKNSYNLRLRARTFNKSIFGK